MEKNYLKLGENMYVEVPSNILSGIYSNNSLVCGDEESGEFQVFLSEAFVDRIIHWNKELDARESCENVIEEINQSSIRAKQKNSHFPRDYF
ncbi:Uncharacterised protein [uncultured archaeon]|nr:Uncharacterised protein [uncultured archaeon]